MRVPLCPDLDTRPSSRLVLVHAQHAEGEDKLRKSSLPRAARGQEKNTRRALPTAGKKNIPNRMDAGETQTKQLSARRTSSSQQKHSVTAGVSPPTHMVTSLPPQATGSTRIQTGIFAHSRRRNQTVTVSCFPPDRVERQHFDVRLELNEDPQLDEDTTRNIATMQQTRLPTSQARAATRPARRGRTNLSSVSICTKMLARHRHYTERGAMQLYEFVQPLAQDMGR